jgi:hypothetical protein
MDAAWVVRCRCSAACTGCGWRSEQGNDVGASAGCPASWLACSCPAPSPRLTCSLTSFCRRRRSSPTFAPASALPGTTRDACRTAMGAGLPLDQQPLPPARLPPTPTPISPPPNSHPTITTSLHPQPHSSPVHTVDPAHQHLHPHPPPVHHHHLHPPLPPLGLWTCGRPAPSWPHPGPTRAPGSCAAWPPPPPGGCCCRRGGSPGAASRQLPPRPRAARGPHRWPRPGREPRAWHPHRRRWRCRLRCRRGPPLAAAWLPPCWRCCARRGAGPGWAGAGCQASAWRPGAWLPAAGEAGGGGGEVAPGGAGGSGA